ATWSSCSSATRSRAETRTRSPTTSPPRSTASAPPPSERRGAGVPRRPRLACPAPPPVHIVHGGPCGHPPKPESRMATQAASPAPFVPLEPFQLDTLTKIVFRAIEHHDRPEAMRYKDGDAWRSLSHREVLERVTHLAAALD